MPAYSKLQRIRTFLIRRKDNRLVQPEHMRQESPSAYVLLPAVAYKMAWVTDREEGDDNIVVRTVVDLFKVLLGRGMERGAALEQVAERTKLNRLLVKTILKRYENSLDVETGKENREPRQRFCYLLYDPIAQSPFPELIPAEEYEASTCLEAVSPQAIDVGGNQGKLKFRASMDVSGWKSVWVLHTEKQALTYPGNPPISRTLERKYQRNGTLTYLGIAEPVGLICTCFLSEDDMTSVHIMNPIGKGTMDQLYENIKRVTAGEPEKNEELSRCLEEMERQRKEALDQVNIFLDSKNVVRQELLLAYPGIEVYPKVWEHMADLESRCKVYRETQENSGTETELLATAGREVLVSFHSTLEDIFYVSLNKNYPRDQKEQLEEMVSRLSGRRNYGEYFAGLAEQVGFGNLDSTREFFASREGKINLPVLRKIVANIRTDKPVKKSLPELVVAHILEAAVWEEHPFREVAVRCPRLLPIVKRSLKLRNDFKHGNEANFTAPSDWEVFQLKALAEAVLDVLLVHRVSGVEIKRERKDYSLRQAAAIKAKEQLEHYPALCKLVNRPAYKVCSRFFCKDGEYFSECSNLLSEVFDQLLSEYSNRSQRERAAEQFSGSAEADDQMLHQLFQQYGCDYESQDRPATGRIKWFIDNGKELRTLSLKCKLYLSFVLLHRERPEILRQLLERAPEILRLTDQVCVERGHSKLTVFSDSPDQYQAFHSQLLENCNGFCEGISAIGEL